MSPLLEIDVDEIDSNAGSLDGGVDVDGVDVDGVDVDDINVDDIHVDDINVDDIHVDGLVLERMPQNNAPTEFNSDNPASSPLVDIDSVHVAKDHEEEPTTISSKNGQVSQEQEIREDRTALENSVVDIDPNAASTQEHSNPVSLLSVAAMPALLHDNGALSRRSGMRKTVSFASVVSTATMVNSRGNKDKKDGAVKNALPLSAEETKALVAGDTASPTTEEPPLNETNDISSPKHTMAPLAPGEGPSTEEHGSNDTVHDFQCVSVLYGLVVQS